ncbi:Isochorismatase hydrolase [Schizopora paradoxa]|uniref:nicotinamidase n=1 Tax=Schizopora paradoxa TaxID=27342 RepID=A0A0H2S9U2_9AGAM|nr:Isochorismatase hydrolase [Schizopora paradoxa]
MSTALLVVDVQYDFLPGGSLGVAGGDEILPVVRRLLDERSQWKVVVASQDFHPPGHISFASSHEDGKVFTAIQIPNVLAGNEPIQQMLWPDHCVQGTRGCEIDESVRQGFDHWVASGKGFSVQKGLKTEVDAYSAFAPALCVSSSAFGTNGTTASEHSPLASHLLSLGVKKLFVVGIATDYCVRATALDAMKSGCFDAVYVVREGVRAVGGDEATHKCLEEFNQAGVQFVSMEDEVVRRMLGE